MASNKKHVFTPIEKKLFADILKKYEIIESKGTDGASLRAKNDAWNKITREFNAYPCATQANNKQLRRLWMNLKHRQKEALMKKHHRQAATAVIDPDDAEVAPAPIISIDEAVDSDTLTETTNIAEEELDTSRSNLMPSQVPSNARLELSELMARVKDEPGSQHDSPTPMYTQPSPPSSPPSPPYIHPTLYPSASMTTSPPSVQCQKTMLLEKEYHDRKRRANQLHELQMQVERERLKEAKAKAREAQAKAELAEFVLALGLDNIRTINP